MEQKPHTPSRADAPADCCSETTRRQSKTALSDDENVHMERIRESEQRLRTILDSLQIGIVIIDAKTHCITDVNPVATDMIGYSKKDIIGKLCHRFICPAEQGKCPIADLHQNVDRSERVMLTAQGQHMPIFKTVKELLLDGKPYLIESVIDITDRKKAEEQIRRMNEELELRIHQRTCELEQANGDLSKSMEELKRAQEHLIEKEKLAALGNLVAGVAHEINTPMGMCITAASQLAEKTTEFGKLAASAALKRSDLDKYITLSLEMTKSILSNLGRATNLIKSFKQVSVDQSSEKQRTFNVKEYIEEILISLKPNYKKTKHSITVHCADIVIRNFPGAFSQIFTNLIMNSLIHGFEHIEEGSIAIDVSMVDSTTLQIRYSDNGKGMDEQTKKNIFYPFFTTKREQGGSGLGTHIIYTIVTKKLNGTVLCNSSPGQGTEFIITVPVTRKTEEESGVNGTQN